MYATRSTSVNIAVSAYTKRRYVFETPFCPSSVCLRFSRLVDMRVLYHGATFKKASALDQSNVALSPVRRKATSCPSSGAKVVRYSFEMNKILSAGLRLVQRLLLGYSMESAARPQAG
jgi:hypothetical protein